MREICFSTGPAYPPVPQLPVAMQQRDEIIAYVASQQIILLRRGRRGHSAGIAALDTSFAYGTVKSERVMPII